MACECHLATTFFAFEMAILFIVLALALAWVRLPRIGTMMLFVGLAAAIIGLVDLLNN